MQMIDVLKRLAELDAANPNRPEYTSARNNTLAESTQIDECGMMPEIGSVERPAVPASINMTAGSGEELGDLIKAIATLAGTATPDDITPAIAAPLSASPTIATASPDGIDMRSMIDKLNVSGDDEDVDLGDNERKADEAYDNTPADPTDTNEFDAEEFAHHENPPGADRKGNSQNPRAYDTNESIATRLMAEYRQFIGESKKDVEMDESEEETDEGIEDRLKDLDPKNPVNIPAYQRKAKSGDSAAAAARSFKESADSADDILKLAGLK